MLKQPDELQSNADLINTAMQRAVSRQLPIVELISCATALASRGQRPQIIELYKTWIAYNSSDPLLHAAYFNYAISLNESGDRAGAINAFQACLKVKPDFYPGYINLGRVLEDCGQTGQAVSQWLALVQNLSAVNGESVSHKLIALEQIGRVLEGANDDAHA